MYKYFSLFKTHLALALEYRSYLVGILISDLISFSSIFVLWLSVFRDQSNVGGLTFSDTVLYYLLVPLVGFFTQVNMAESVASEIRYGNLSTHLLKPQRIWFQYIVRWVAAKVNALIIIAPLYAIVLIAIKYVFQSQYLTITLLIVALCIAAFAFLFSILTDLFFAWMAFWLDDIWWFKHFKLIVFGILAGASFPFEFLPNALRIIVEILPFKFMYYIPIQYLIGNRSISMLVIDFIQLGLWSLVVYLAARILWDRGINKYESYGN